MDTRRTWYLVYEFRDTDVAGCDPFTAMHRERGEDPADNSIVDAKCERFHWEFYRTQLNILRYLYTL